jgi:hypothetical protein
MRPSMQRLGHRLGVDPADLQVLLNTPSWTQGRCVTGEAS